MCTEKPSATTSNFNFINRALTHTTVNCTWDEPEEGNAKNAILFKDNFDEKIDLDDFIAPEIDEGYDPDDDQNEADGGDVGVDSGASSSEEEEVVESKPTKKIVKADTKQISKKPSLAEVFTKSSKENTFSDFDKSKKKAKGLKISFQNPLESKFQDDEDGTLGKREYKMKPVKQYNSRLDDEFRVGNSRLEDNVEDFFEGDDHNQDGHDAQLGEEVSKVEKVKLKFKERMKEKKKMAKLEKEKKRNELRELREENFTNKKKATQDLELIAGDAKERAEFKPNYKDSRFAGAFEDPDMAIDTTSTMFKKDKHTAMIIEKKKHRSEYTHSN